MISDKKDNTESAGSSRRAFLGTATAIAVFGFNRLTLAQDSSALYTQLGNVTIRDGKEEEVLQIFRELTELHRENSPGLLVYLIHRSEAHPRRIVTFEVFQDKPRAQAIAGAQSMFPFYRRLQAAAENVENVPLDRVLGFLR